MIEISDELKKEFNSDSGNKELILEFYKNYNDTEPMCTLRNENIISESMELNEGISTEQNIRYGQCYSSKFSVEIFNLKQTLINDVDFVGYKLKAFIKIKDIESSEVPLFVGVIKNSELKDNRNTRKLTAYDILSDKLNTDITNLFWTDLINNRTVKYVRKKILDTLNITYTDTVLINDDKEFFKYLFSDEEGKTKINTKIIARKALESVLEMCGCFGHINRYGIFEFKVLKNTKFLYPTTEDSTNVKYPSNTLFPGLQDPNVTYEVDYPSNTLFPGLQSDNKMLYPSPKKIISNKEDTVNIGRNYIKCRYGEFITNNITGIQLINKDNIIVDAYISSNKNVYVSKGNLFIDQQMEIGRSTTYFSENLYVAITNNIYTPYNLECIGMPYIEVGDYVTFKPLNDDQEQSPLTVPILSRTLKGIQSLKDTYSAKGTEDRTQRI